MNFPISIPTDPERDYTANPLTLDDWASAFATQYIGAGGACSPDIACALASHGAFVFMDGETQKWRTDAHDTNYAADPKLRALVAEQTGL